MFAKIDVNGKNAAPLYEYLKDAKPGLLGSEAIKWNFTKFLVDRKGKVVERYARRSSQRRSPTTSKSCFSVSTFAPHRRGAAWTLAVLLSSAIAAAVAPAHAADSAKVLHVAIPVAETGFDPQAAGDAIRTTSTA
jgi:hypothetical protein